MTNRLTEPQRALSALPVEIRMAPAETDFNDLLRKR
jgi:hypothetical protein